MALAMDTARGERQLTTTDVVWIFNNTSCPATGSVDSGKAWFFYADYATMMTEYIYWSVSSNYGMHDSSAGRKKSKTEWCPNTNNLLKAQDPAVYKLVNNPKYAFPVVLPNASYSYYTFKKSDIKAL